MKKLSCVFLSCLILFASLLLCACNGDKKIEYCGNIIYNNAALEGVVLEADDRAICVTDENGNFSFRSSQNSIKIYPEKEGYYFEPEFVIVTEENPECNFIAKKEKALNGKLNLNKIIIKPTYIVSYSDNYLYRNEEKDCLKAFNISLNFKGELIDLITEDMFLYKNENNEILIEEDVEIVCGTQTQIGFLINTYFKYNYIESHTTYSEYSYLYIAGDQTNNKLQNNQIEYTLVGINNKSNKFTFNISFVFDYNEATNELV